MPNQVVGVVTRKVSVPCVPFLIAALLLVAALGGCGYTIGGTLPAHIKTVAVPIFANRTQQPGVEGVVTRGIVEALSTNGRLRLAPASEADAVLEGEVIGYWVGALAFDQSANITVYRVSVVLNLKLRDVREKKTIFERAGVAEQSDVQVGGAVSTTISRELDALQSAATAIGQSVASLVVHRF